MFTVELYATIRRAVMADGVNPFCMIASVADQRRWAGQTNIATTLFFIEASKQLPVMIRFRAANALAAAMWWSSRKGVALVMGRFFWA